MMPPDPHVYLPPQYRLFVDIAGNTVRQLHRAGTLERLSTQDARVSNKPVKVVTRADGSEVLITNMGMPPNSFAGDILRVRGRALDEAVLGATSFREWLKTPIDCITSEELARARAAEVLESWDGQFFYRMEDPATKQLGLRPPQMGALWAVLAHWTVAPHQPATIAMPTGTGKTETMLALLVNQRLPRVLVVVPNSALREQIANKFLSLGVLRKAGVIGDAAALPVVGMIEHLFQDPDEADVFLSLCNVVVTTIQAINACREEVRRKVSERCTHLFIDEAHHVKAPSWESFRRRFHGKPIVQFTATPFREDGKHVGGRMIYCYPLGKAQQEGYFRPICYRSVFTYRDADRRIAETAVDQLRKDLNDGFDHLVMARVDTIERASEIHKIYQELAPEFHPLCIHSKMSARVRDQAIQSLRSKASRIIVCVDMLGEGFDLPQLKIAALHDIHKSLAITLQFTGRFTRTIGEDEPPIGNATMIANRARSSVRQQLRVLYAEDPNWDQIIQELSEGATGEERAKSEFQETFGTLPPEVSIQNLEPRMSTVVFRTDGSAWIPDHVDRVFPEEKRYTREVARSEQHRMLWFVTREAEEVRWGDLKDLANVTHHLYVIHWDEERSLLFINSSNNGSLHEELAKALCGEATSLFRGLEVYRAMHGINRMVPTNLGLLDAVSRTRRFMMLVGADTTEGLDPVQSRSKTKTNLFGFGFENGSRVSIGCSLKGRIWSYLIANDLSAWMQWCHHIGTKLLDDTITTDTLFRNFAKPVAVTERPTLVPLAIEWPLAFLVEQEERICVKVGETEALFFDVDLEIVEHTRDKPVRFRVVTERDDAEYQVSFGADGTRYLPVGKEATIRIGKRERPLSEWFRHYAPKLFFEQDTFIEHDLLLRINRDIPPFDPDRIEAWDWTGVTIKKESQGPQRATDSVQYHLIQQIRASGTKWDILFDDDDSGEVADVVAIRMDGQRLIVHLYHCKYSGEEKAGSRVDDFYAVCGQAQKSVRWRERTGLAELIPHLIHREQLRLGKGEPTRFEIGDCSTLEDIAQRLDVLRPEFKVFVVQPGLSQPGASHPVLELLAATSLYLFETFNVEFGVIANSQRVK